MFEEQFSQAPAPAQTPVEQVGGKAKKPKLEDPPDSQRITITSIPEDNDVKPLDVRVFRLASLPKIDGVIEPEDDESSIVETVNIQKLGEETDICQKVLIFNIDKSIPQKTLKEEFFDKISDITSVKKTVTLDDKYRGVYLASFASQSAAREFVTEPIDLETKCLARLDKILLRDYRIDRFFQRQILKSRSFKKAQGRIIETLSDLKKTEKLTHCVIIDLKDEVDEEAVNDYFSGLESEFVDKYELEDLPRRLDSPKCPKYALLFQSHEEAKDFVTQTDLHKIEDHDFKVTLLTDLMRKIRYGDKVKNFTDSKYTEAEDSRRIVIGVVKNEPSPEDVRTYAEKTFPGVEDIHRCMNLDFFLGLYVLTFPRETDAQNALDTELGPGDDVLKNPISMSLKEYTEKRSKFLKDLFPRSKRKREDSQDSSDDSWVREFEDIKELHSKLWGKEAEEKEVNFLHNMEEPEDFEVETKLET